MLQPRQETARARESGRVGFSVWHILHRLMEPETERTRRHLKKGRKRRRAPNRLVGAAEAKTACRKLEERQPEVKVQRGARGCVALPDPRPSHLHGPSSPWTLSGPTTPLTSQMCEMEMMI